MQMIFTFYLKYMSTYRTHTVILVDGRGRVDYVECTMKEPIDIPATDSAEWVTTRMQFTINEQPSARIVSRL